MQLRCPVLVGRRDELAEASAAVTAATLGRGRALVVAGEPGVGKSRLVEEVCRIGTDRGLPCLIGRATLESQAVPLRAWTEALAVGFRNRPFPHDEGVEPYRGVLGLFVPHWRTDGWRAPVEPPVVVGEAVVRLLSAVASGEGRANAVVVVLEDLHWADDTTIEVLDHVAQHISGVPAVVVATCRQTGRGSEVVRRLGAGGAACLTLGRLSVSETAEMIAACRPGDSRSDATEALVRASEGLPLAVEDLIASQARGGPLRRFGVSVRSRVERLDDIARRCVSIAAVIGERVDWRVIEHAVNLGSAASDNALRDALELDLLVVDQRGVRFRHALTRQVVLDDQLPTERLRLSRTAAEALLKAGADELATSELVAELFVAAGLGGRAVEILEELSAQSELDGDVQGAERLCARALEIAHDSGDRATAQQAARLGTSLARLHLSTGRTRDAIELAERLLGRSEGVDRERSRVLRVLLARGHVMRGAWADADAQLATIRRGALPETSVAEVALLEAECAFGSDRPGQRAAIEHQALKAIALAERTGRAELICEALLLGGRVARLRDLDAAARSLELALDAAARGGLHATRLRVLDELGTVEMLRDARTDRLERAHSEALRFGAFGAAASTGVNLASAYVMTGRHAECDELAGRVGTSAARLGIMPLEAACSLMRGIAAAFDDDAERSEPHLQRAESLAQDDADLRLGAWAIGRGIGALVAGDIERARWAFARARELAPQRHARILDAAVGPSLLLRAIAGEDLVDEARATRETEPRGARWSELWTGAAIATGMANHGDRISASHQLDLALLAGARYPLFGALVRRLIGPVAVRTSFTDPTLLLRDAEASFDLLGLMRPAAEVRSQLRTLGQAAPRRRLGDGPVADDLRRFGVTSREAEVLDLLADRLTNREIASRLFVSAKTIEKHVASLAGKLNARDRHDLAEVARTRHHH